MGTIVSYVLVAGAGVLAAPAFIFFLEILAATVPTRWLRRSRPGSKTRPSATVIVPAHNEGAAVLPTLSNIQRQLRGGDRLLVVADNCSDQTAMLARETGAEVTERIDPTKRGKGYALDWGVRYLCSDPPEVVVIVDADCKLVDGALDELISACAEAGRPTQALYLMKAPPSSQTNHQVAEFAWRVKNWLRPLGLRLVNLPCQLMGTGMAFPWRVIRSANLASSEIVEDLKLGIDLTQAGYPPLFCPSAGVTSEFPSSAVGTGTQRSRWEKGHLDLILKVAPRLISIAIWRRDISLLAVALDLSVPPLSLLSMLVLASFGISLLNAIFGGSFIALGISSASLVAVASGTFLAWLKCGQDVVPLLLIPSYAFRKFGFYRSYFSRGTDSEWTRTDRNKTD